MPNDVEVFDIILVYTSFRRHENYINIIKCLASRLRIGLLKFEAKHSWTESEEKYFRMCLEYGAILVKEKAECHTLIISRFGGNPGSGYFKDILEDMPRYIKYGRVLVNVTTLMSGIPKIKEICKFLGDPIIITPGAEYFAEFEPETKAFLREHPLVVVEVGIPYLKFPIFPEFSTDYILAYPSHTVISQDWQHYRFLKNITAALRKLPKKVKVVVKPHNARDDGNKLSRLFILRLFPALRWLIRPALWVLRIFDITLKGRSSYERLPNRLLKYIIYLHNDYIFSRCENLLDKYASFGIEHFLSGIRKGIITGLSNTIVLALIAKKPVYNADDLPLDDKPDTYRIIVEKFGVKQWKGFSSDGFGLIGESVRTADLMDYLESTVKIDCVSGYPGVAANPVSDVADKG